MRNFPIYNRIHTIQKLFPPGLEPGTFRVLGERDNRYTTETRENEILEPDIGTLKLVLK